MTRAAIVELASGDARARISRAGAEWIGWSVAGRELLWKPDPAFWDRVAPILFPVCGWTRGGVTRVDGVEYPLGLHGFASGETFDLVGQAADAASFVLRDTARTRALYPFAFELSVTFRLSSRELSIEARVCNRGERAMPYAFGLHPGFAWPFAGAARAGHAVEFDAAPRGEVPVIAPGGLFSSATRPVAMDGARLPLTDDTFSREALCFLNAPSGGLRFRGPGGSIRVETDGFPHVVLWSRPDAPFLCVESWTGHGDPVDFAGDLADKPSMISLRPGGEGAHVARYRLEPVT